MLFSNAKSDYKDSASSLGLVIVMSLSMMLLSILSISAFSFSQTANSLGETLRVQVFLEDELKELEIVRTVNKLSESGFLGVSSIEKSVVKFTSKSEAAFDIIKDTGVNFHEVLRDNPLKNVCSFSIDPLVDINSETIKKFIKSIPGVLEVDCENHLLSLLSSKIRLSLNISIFVIVALTFITVALFLSSIKIFLYSDRIIIKTMMLIGAKTSFVCKIYLKKIIFLCLVASILSANVIFGLCNYLITNNLTLALLDNIRFCDIAIVISSVCIGSILVSIFGGYYSIRKYAFGKNFD